jgi:hypothetical protein
MSRQSLISVILASFLPFVPAQAASVLLENIAPAGGGNAFPDKVHDAIPVMKRFVIESELARNSLALQAAGKLVIDPRAPQVSNLQFPLRARAGFVGASFYGISNYVDLNPTIVARVLTI